MLTEEKRKFRTEPQPLCPIHGVPMHTRSTRKTEDELKKVRYCYCPVEGCRQSEKQVVYTDV